MKKTMIAIPEMPARSLQTYTLHQERQRDNKNKWTYGDPDFRTGEKDARISPSAWPESLDGIDQDENMEKEKIRNVLEQNIRDSRDTLQLFPGLKEQNRKKTDELAAEGGLLPEATAANMLKSANWWLFVSAVLIVVEVVGLVGVSRSAFGNGLTPICIAILVSFLFAIFVNYFLSGSSKQRRNWVLWSGGFLLLIGILGFVVLRSQTFSVSLTGGNIDFQQLTVGNMLLMVGLTFGVPLMVGAMYEDASEKRTKALNSLALYYERQSIDKCEAAWKSVLGKLEEYQLRIDGITNSIVKSRQSSYRQGFHRSAAGNPDAKPHLQELMAAAR